MRNRIPARWRKLGRDLWLQRGRVLLMLVAVTVSVIAVGAVLGARAVLTREMALNYLGTHPATATLEMSGDVDAAVLDLARRQPQVASAEPGDAILSRARVGDDWRPLLLFVVDDFARTSLNTVRPDRGAFPPPDGTVMLERTAVQFLAADIGQRLRLQTPHGTLQELAVSGLVHDPGLAPAWQERTGYAYVSRATLRQLGEDGAPHELRLGLRDDATSAQAEASATAVARALAGAGHRVLEVRVPPPRQHPHQRQMNTVLLLLLAFALMALLLSGVLVANTLNALLARQVREIGVMKTIGARTGQLAGMYVALVVALGAAALLLAVPASLAAAQAFSSDVATMLNLQLDSAQVPLWVVGVQALAALVVPTAVAAVPIWRACRASVRETIDRHGVGGERIRRVVSRWPMALRNAVRRPRRLALTLCLLAAGGAMFMSAINMAGSWQRTIDKVYETRHYDLEVRLGEAQSAGLAAQLRQLPGVRAAEAWGWARTAYAQAGRPDVSHAYPDQGHGSFVMMAPPPATRLIRFPVLAGRWLRPGDTDAVVLSHAAAALRPDLRPGDPVLLSVGDRPHRFTLVGIVEEIGAAGVAYVSDDEFARLTGNRGKARLLRVATSATEPAARVAIARAVEAELGRLGARIEVTMPVAELRTAIGDHIVILVRALTALAVVMAVVGGLGLASTLGIGVLERTRELAVMKTLGATRRRVVGMVLGEALAVGALSCALALAIALPLTLALDVMVGRLGFVAPLPFSVSGGALAGWIAAVALISLLAAWPPALRAARLSVAQGLASV
jgi:putative ABC transport system permease protein